MGIEHFEPRAVIAGLLAGEDFSSRVGGSCVYGCPRCSHRIRFRWQHFYQADERSLLQRPFRRHFDQLTPALPPAEQGFIDFHCPTCQAPTRLIFRIAKGGAITFHFDMYAVLVGEGSTPAAAQNRQPALLRGLARLMKKGRR